MRHTFRLFFIITTLFLFQTSAQAALNLMLTKGVSTALPIAVVPFSGQADLPPNSNISAVVMNDLQNSGQFKVMSPDSMTQTPHIAANVDYQYWRKTAGVDNVVVGQVKALGGSQYQVSFSLMDVFKGQGQTSQVLLTKQFTIPGNQLRALAHHISDLVYQQLTGVRGIFSTRIAYILVQRGEKQSKYILEVADEDGYNPKALLTSRQPIMSPSWSHDGKNLAYVSFENTTPEIFIQNAFTGARHAVSSFPGINGAPAWSPDNSKLAIVLSKNGAPKIFIKNLSSGELKQVTFGSAIDTEPSFSKDGSSLIFTSDRGGGPQIYQLNLASGEIKRLTFHGNYNATASFTPDEKSIVMLNREQGGYNIAVQDLKTGTVQVLTHSGEDASPSVAPNGQVVLYESDVSRSQGVLGMVSIDGRVHLRIPAQIGSVQDPAWSPFSG